jgi:uncharacterized protein YndB with AHSA1/START domain
MLLNTAAAPSQFRPARLGQHATKRLHVDPVVGYIRATKRLHMTATTVTDRIEKTVILKAPRSRIWRALSDATQFGEWFKVKLDGQFKAGATIHGTITYPGYEGLTLEMAIERIEPERLFSYRWHPGDPKGEYGAEPMTLVEFTLEDVPGGTRLTIVESGFDKIPLARRAEAFRMNEGGWTEQIENIRRHVPQS